MKRAFLILFLFTFSFWGFAQKIELEGTYQGKNIYVQNPLANTGKGFCTEKVLINGKEVAVSNTSAYEIKLDSLGFKLDDTIKIEIFHKADCKPKLITPHYTPKGNFDLVSIHIDSSFVLHWVSKNEINKLTYTIEQFRWNKWIKIGEVDGKGGIQENAYSFQTQPHSGLNRLRVKQVASGKPRISKTAEIEVPDLDIQIIGNKNKLWEAIHFNKKTMYELYDRKGDIVKKGDGINIGIKGLEQNFYYLNYDNKTETITIRSK